MGLCPLFMIPLFNLANTLRNLFRSIFNHKYNSHHPPAQTYAPPYPSLHMPPTPQTKQCALTFHPKLNSTPAHSTPTMYQLKFQSPTVVYMVFFCEIVSTWDTPV